MRVRLVAVGDELVLGDVVDTNSAWIARRLAGAGLRPAGAVTVPDDVPAIVAAVRAAADDAGAVVVTGGLGPTSDDRTREALAVLTGQPLRRDPDLLAKVEATHAARGRSAPPTAARQADLPAGAAQLANDSGTAPGLAVHVGGVPVFAVPGVPREMEHVVERHVLPALAAHARPWSDRLLRVALLGESDVAERLRPLERALPADVRLAYVASPGEVLVRLSGPDVAPYADRARALLGDAVAGEGAEGPAATVLRLLRDRAQTLAVAESLTGGLLGASLTAVPGASAVVRGGLLAYATDLKAGILGVEPALLAASGPVHPDVALAMARGARERCAATYGAATTGVAGPEPQGGAPVGTVHVAVSGPAGDRVRSARLGGDRAVVRTATVAHALDLLRRAVLGLPDAPAEWRP